MDITFICLANSYKHNNRCIAGIIVSKRPGSSQYSIVRDNDGNPKWFRPVDRNTDAGAIPNDVASDIHILSIVKAHDVIPCPDGAQTENHYYSRLNTISRISRKPENLNCLIDARHHLIFNNRGVAVHPDAYTNLNYSVLLIKSTDVHFYLRDRSQFGKEAQPRGVITHNGVEYDLPVTDPEFRKIIKEDINRSNSYGEYYITLSLGVEYDEWHSKLIACVIVVEDENATNRCITTPHQQNNTSSQSCRTEDTKSISYNLFCQGYTIDQIAEERGLTTSTIGNHLMSFIESGNLNIRRLVSASKISRVVSYKRTHPEEDKLRPYFEAFNEEISFMEIKWILAAITSGHINM